MTVFTELVSNNGPFILTTSAGVKKYSNFGAGVDTGAYRRIDL
jgi:hypothetical protein